MKGCLAIDYVLDRRPDAAAPETNLWRSVLALALHDLANPDPKIRQDASEVIEGSDLLRAMDLAGIDRGHAGRLRAMVLAGEEPPPIRRRQGRLYTLNGETHSLREWSR